MFDKFKPVEEIAGRSWNKFPFLFKRQLLEADLKPYSKFVLFKGVAYSFACRDLDEKMKTTLILAH